MAEVSARSHAALSTVAFRLVFLSDKHPQGADGLIVTMLSEAEFAVGSGLTSCLTWVFANLTSRGSSVSDMYVFGKFGKSCCSLRCPQGWIT